MKRLEGGGGIDLRGGNAAMVAELIRTLGAGAPLGAGVRNPSLGVLEAYGIADRVRGARVDRGARTVGRKIGFTNAELARRFGAPGPIWGWVYDRTLVRRGDVRSPYRLEGLCEPRLEPEIVIGLSDAPSPGMDEHELAACVGWAALGIELVQSVYPGWRFTAAEAIAGHGLHGALLVGPNIPVEASGADAGAALAEVTVLLQCEGRPIAEGVGANAHGGPLRALAWLVAELDRTGGTPLGSGEVVTTGTLTGAHPIAAGETWRLAARGADGRSVVPPFEVRFA